MPTLAELQASAASLAAEDSQLNLINAAADAADSQALVAQNEAAAADSQSLASSAALGVAEIKTAFAEVLTQKCSDTKDKAFLAVGSDITESTPSERTDAKNYATDTYNFVLMIRDLVSSITTIKNTAVSRDSTNTAVTTTDRDSTVSLYDDITAKLNAFNSSSLNTTYLTSNEKYSTVVSFLEEIIEKLFAVKIAATAAVTTNNEGNRKGFKELSEEALTRILVINDAVEYVEATTTPVPAVTLFDKIKVTKIAAELAASDDSNLSSRTEDTNTKALAAYNGSNTISTATALEFTTAKSVSAEKTVLAKIANKSSSRLASAANAAAASASSALSLKNISAGAFGDSLPSILQPKICGIDLTKQALLNAIADKKKKLIDGLKNKAQAQIDMAQAKLKSSTDSLINKLVSNIPALPENYKGDIATLLKKIIGPPPLNSDQINAEVAALASKWGTTVTNGLADLVQNFTNGVTQDLCEIEAVKNYEKIGNNLPLVKPLESFIPTAVPEPIANLIPTVEDKSAVPNTDRVADTVVPKTVKENYRTIIERPLGNTILNVITDFYATNRANFSNTSLPDEQRWSLLYLDLYNLGLKRKVEGVDISKIKERMKTLKIQYYDDFYTSGKASDSEIKFLNEFLLADNTSGVARYVWLSLCVIQTAVEKKVISAITPEEYSKAYSETRTDLATYLKTINGKLLVKVKVDYTFTNEDIFKISYKTTSTQFSINEVVAKMETLYSANAQLIKDYYAVKDNK